MRRSAPVLLTLALGLAAAPAQAADVETLGVLGHAEVEATPDVASFTAEVVRTSPTSVGARSATNGRLQAIVRALTGLGVPRASITTTGVTLSRQRVRTPKTRALRIRYRAAGAFAVRVSSVELTGKALDAAAAAGATGVDGPEFDFSPAASTKARTAAEQAALTDARSRADAAAASQGQRVVGVQSIELDPSSAKPTAAGDVVAASAPASASSGKAAAPAPVLPGTQTFESDVRVVYTLAPAG